MDYDVAAHNSRVFAGSGVVPDNITTDKHVKLLKQNNLWDSCVFFAAPSLGVKKDGNQFVSKVYDLKANADLAQATGTAQPKYQSDGSLLFDGVGALLSTVLPVDNTIRNTVNNFTVCSSFIRTANKNGTYHGLLARATSPTYRCYQLIINQSDAASYPNTIRFFTIRGTTILKASSVTYPTVVGDKYSVIADWNGENIGLMVNGVVDSGTNELTGTGSVNNYDSPILIGKAFVSDTYNMIGKINKTMMFNKILTAQEKVIVNEILSDWS